MLDLNERAQAIRRAFYRQHDGNGHWYWVENVYLDTLVAYAEHDERWYRVGYTFDESATDPVITFAEESTWERVQSEWMPVADGNGVRSMATLRVRKLPDVMPEDLPSIITRDGHTGYQTRTMNGQVRYLAEEKRTEIILNTDDVDSHRTIVDPAGGEWETAFRGKFFIGHDMNRVAGLSPAPELRDGQWVVSVADADWDLEDDDIANWHRKVKRGFVTDVSIGFDPVDGHWDTVTVNGAEQRVFRFTKWRGIEWSWVGMGSNSGAVVTERSAQTATQTRSAPASQPHTPEQPAPERRANDTPEQPSPRQFEPAALREMIQRRADRRRELALRKLGKA